MVFKHLLFGIWIFLHFGILAQQSKIDSLEAVIAKGKEDVETAKAINLLSYEFVRTDVVKAKQYLWKAKSLSLSLKDYRTLSASYSQLTSLHQNEAQMDSARIYLKLLKELAFSATGPDANIIKGNYYSTAGLFYKKSGKIKEALDYFILTRNIAIENGDVISASGQGINIGNSYLGLSDFNLALHYYLEALKGFEQAKHKKGQSFCYQNIAECYIELNRYSSAIEYVNKSIVLKKEMNDRRGLGNAEQSLGRIYMGLEDYERALFHYKKALSVVQELKLTNEEVKVSLNLGKIFTLKNDSEKALSYFEKSKVLAQKLGDSSSVITADLEILSLKEISIKQKEIEANALVDIQTLKESGAISKQAAGYKNLAEYYTNLKQYDKALEFTNLYNSLTDSIKNNEIQAQFKNIEEQYNKVNNEKQIELLQKDQLINSEKLKQQRFLLLLSGAIILFISLGIWMLIYRNKLRQKMKEIELRNQIAADLHDEVGSSLSSIFMLSKMAADSLEKNQQTILSKVSDNAHETMDKMSDIVWMLKPSENYGVGLKERMERFIHDLCHSRGIHYSFIANDLEKIKLTPTQSKNLYLIVKEGVNNAIKYANTKNLEVKIKEENKKLQLIIKDEGSGFNLKTDEKGNGITNMTNRAIELKGILKIDSEPQKGTRIHLSFPVS